MDQKLLRGITYYSGIAGLLVAGEVKGQVIYVDITPDDTVGSGFGWRDLDLDNNGVMDFFADGELFSGGACAGYSSTDSFNVQGLIFYKYPGTANKVAIGNPGNCLNWINKAKVFNQNDIINNAQPFQPDIGMVRSFYDPCYANFCWGGIAIGTEKFIGLNFKIGLDEHYAWLRFNVIDSMSMVLKDFAYESSPNTGIRAGDTLSMNTSISENLLEMSIHISGKTVTIVGENQLTGGTLLVFDLAGRKVHELRCDQNEMQFNLQIQGIYFLEYTSRNGISSRKKIFVH